MRKLIVTGCCLVLLAALSGCENTRRTLGMGKQAPDEFAVLTRAPLELPPDYGLRPPAPGAQRPQEATTRAQARRILLGAASADKAARPGATFSRGETAILKRAGALNPDPTIRRKVNRESTSIADAEAGFLDRIIFWQRPDAPGGRDAPFLRSPFRPLGRARRRAVFPC